jgi:SNF2 family DNA or RNA helicase
VLHELPENRTRTLLELLEEYDGKAVIWVSYDYSVRKVYDALAKAYGPHAVVRFWGGNANEREEEDRRFRVDPKVRFMVATPDSGGRGRKWDVADTVIYYSSRDNLEHRDQSEERVKDMTKTSATLYIDLIVPGTVDEAIIRALRDKIDLSRVITGDNFREWLI